MNVILNFVLSFVIEKYSASDILIKDILQIPAIYLDTFKQLTSTERVRP